MLLLIFLVGCAEALLQGESPGQRSDYGQLSLFMSEPEKASDDITFNLTAVNAMAEDGTYREITSSPLDISSIAMSGRQILLGERALPEGAYKKLQLIIKEAKIKRKDRVAQLALPPEGIQLDIKFTVSRNRNTSLFLSWYADASVVDGYLFKPALAVSGQVPQLRSLLVYVTNEGSNNVFVINRQSGEVVATIMVGKKPRGIAVGTKRDSLKVYVANSGSNSISVIDPATNKVDTEIPVRFGWGAEGIAVAKLSPERELILVTNYSSNTVSIVDGSTYQEMEKINVGNGPIAVATDPPLDDILNAPSFLSLADINILKNYRERFINVYVVNKNSKNISIVRIDVSTGRSVDVVNVGVEWTPVALGMDFQRGKVYVANYDSDKLSVIDIVKFVKGNRADIVSAINNVGNATIGVIADPSFNRVYLLNELTDAIIVIKSPSEGSENLRAVITPTIDIIAVGNAPKAMALDPEARKLYVVNRGAGNISVVDKTTRKVEKVIPAGKRPYGIAILNR
ncbi:MAG: YncE family protein [Deltaproteobacteria bacterium]